MASSMGWTGILILASAVGAHPVIQIAAAHFDNLEFREAIALLEVAL